MRWTRLTYEAAGERAMHWQRKFAWWPVLNQDACRVIWLEYVWRRRPRKSNGDVSYAYRWEYRSGGREAPDVKVLHPLVLAARQRKGHTHPNDCSDHSSY